MSHAPVLTGIPHVQPAFAATGDGPRHGIARSGRCHAPGHPTLHHEPGYPGPLEHDFRREDIDATR